MFTIFHDKNKKNVKTVKKREWDPSLVSTSNSSNLASKFDYSKKEPEGNENKKDKYQSESADETENSDIEFHTEESKVESSNSVFSKLKNSLLKIADGRKIDTETLKPILENFKEELSKKNVAESIASNICEHLLQELISVKIDLLGTVYKVARQSLKDSLTNILTPKNHIDLLASALKKKQEGRTFVIVFIGVNGVGKSTNLAKVAHLLKTNGFSIMLAACDNFRSGAVEQLRIHGKCLGLPVFDRGYKDDAANIARDAILEAQSKKIDVVLVDTAGRMQDNEPLMRALSRLVNINNPDLVLFIGEALTGNDGVDQLTKFNNALKEMSANLTGGVGLGREIDGIILSKFDTVDDKVGAALSLTYATGKPIVYVGIGQKYNCLKKLNVDSVVNSLLS